MQRYRAQMAMAASLGNPLLAAAEMQRIQRNAAAFARRHNMRRPSTGLFSMVGRSRRR